MRPLVLGLSVTPSPRVPPGHGAATVNKHHHQSLGNKMKTELVKEEVAFLANEAGVAGGQAPAGKGRDWRGQAQRFPIQLEAPRT